MTSTRRKARKTLGGRGADFGAISIVHEMAGVLPEVMFQPLLKEVQREDVQEDQVGFRASRLRACLAKQEAGHEVREGRYCEGSDSTEAI